MIKRLNTCNYRQTMQCELIQNMTDLIVNIHLLLFKGTVNIFTFISRESFSRDLLKIMKR